MFHRDGEAAAATVCAEEGAYYCLSSMATTGLAEVSSLLPEQPKLLQLYLWKDRALLRDVLQGARESGFTALALTCDTPWLGNRERDVHNGFTIPADVRHPLISNWGHSHAYLLATNLASSISLRCTVFAKAGVLCSAGSRMVIRFLGEPAVQLCAAEPRRRTR